MEQTTTELRQAEELLGAMFTVPKELRHIAEQAFGQEFVPTELVHEDDHAADLILRPAGVGQVHVHAERERDWYPFRVTRVDAVTG
jgi:hypothetical protein